MKKIFKKFLKSKRGNMIVLVICLTPVILTVLSSVIAVNRRDNAQKSETLISLDAFCDFVNQKYGKVLKVDGKNTCSFSNANQNTISTYFEEYYKSIDGYNKYWTTKFEFSVDSKTKDTNYTITCTTVLPKLSNTTSMTNYWGTLDLNGNATGGWYAEHQNWLEIAYKNSTPDSNWVINTVEVTSSCV